MAEDENWLDEYIKDDAQNAFYIDKDNFKVETDMKEDWLNLLDAGVPYMPSLSLRIITLYNMFMQKCERSLASPPEDPTDGDMLRILLTTDNQYEHTNKLYRPIPAGDDEFLELVNMTMVRDLNWWIGEMVYRNSLSSVDVRGGRTRVSMIGTDDKSLCDTGGKTNGVFYLGQVNPRTVDSMKDVVKADRPETFLDEDDTYKYTSKVKAPLFYITAYTIEWPATASKSSIKKVWKKMYSKVYEVAVDMIKYGQAKGLGVTSGRASFTYPVLTSLIVATDKYSIFEGDDYLSLPNVPLMVHGSYASTTFGLCINENDVSQPLVANQSEYDEWIKTTEPYFQQVADNATVMNAFYAQDTAKDLIAVFTDIKGAARKFLNAERLASANEIKKGQMNEDISFYDNTIGLKKEEKDEKTVWEENIYSDISDKETKVSTALSKYSEHQDSWAVYDHKNEPSKVGRNRVFSDKLFERKRISRYGIYNQGFNTDTNLEKLTPENDLLAGTTKENQKSSIKIEHKILTHSSAPIIINLCRYTNTDKRLLQNNPDSDVISHNGVAFEECSCGGHSYGKIEHVFDGPKRWDTGDVEPVASEKKQKIYYSDDLYYRYIMGKPGIIESTAFSYEEESSNKCTLYAPLIKLKDAKSVNSVTVGDVYWNHRSEGKIAKVIDREVIALRMTPFSEGDQIKRQLDIDEATLCGLFFNSIAGDEEGVIKKTIDLKDILEFTKTCAQKERGYAHVGIKGSIFGLGNTFKYKDHIYEFEGRSESKIELEAKETMGEDEKKYDTAKRILPGLEVPLIRCKVTGQVKEAFASFIGSKGEVEIPSFSIGYKKRDIFVVDEVVADGEESKKSEFIDLPLSSVILSHNFASMYFYSGTSNMGHFSEDYNKSKGTLSSVRTKPGVKHYFEHPGVFYENDEAKTKEVVIKNDETDMNLYLQDFFHVILDDIEYSSEHKCGIATIAVTPKYASKNFKPTEYAKFLENPYSKMETAGESKLVTEGVNFASTTTSVIQVNADACLFRYYTSVSSTRNRISANMPCESYRLTHSDGEAYNPKSIPVHLLPYGVAGVEGLPGGWMGIPFLPKVPNITDVFNMDTFISSVSIFTTDTPRVSVDCCFEAWTKEYGEAYGYYTGTTCDFTNEVNSADSTPKFYRMKDNSADIAFVSEAGDQPINARAGSPGDAKWAGLRFDDPVYLKIKFKVELHSDKLRASVL